jgi:hypothetical protein
LQDADLGLGHQRDFGQKIHGPAGVLGAVDCYDDFHAREPSLSGAILHAIPAATKCVVRDPGAGKDRKNLVY